MNFVLPMRFYRKQIEARRRLAIHFGVALGLQSSPALPMLQLLEWNSKARKERYETFYSHFTPLSPFQIPSPRPGMATNRPNHRSNLIGRIQHEIRHLALPDLGAVSADRCSTVRNLFGREVKFSRRVPLFTRETRAFSLRSRSNQLQVPTIVRPGRYSCSRQMYSGDAGWDRREMERAGCVCVEHWARPSEGRQSGHLRC